MRAISQLIVRRPYLVTTAITLTGVFEVPEKGGKASQICTSTFNQVVISLILDPILNAYIQQSADSNSEFLITVD